jgi:hypothetical protein
MLLRIILIIIILFLLIRIIRGFIKGYFSTSNNIKINPTKKKISDYKDIEEAKYKEIKDEESKI